MVMSTKKAQQRKAQRQSLRRQRGQELGRDDSGSTPLHIGVDGGSGGAVVGTSSAAAPAAVSSTTVAPTSSGPQGLGVTVSHAVIGSTGVVSTASLSSPLVLLTRVDAVTTATSTATTGMLVTAAVTAPLPAASLSGGGGGMIPVYPTAVVSGGSAGPGVPATSTYVPPGMAFVSPAVPIP